MADALLTELWGYWNLLGRWVALAPNRLRAPFNINYKLKTCFVPTQSSAHGVCRVKGGDRGWRSEDGGEGGGGGRPLHRVWAAWQGRDV